VLRVTFAEVHTIQLASAYCNHNFEGVTFGSSISVLKGQAEKLGLKTNQKVWFAKSDGTGMTGPYVVKTIANSNEYMGQHNLLLSGHASKRFLTRCSMIPQEGTQT